jgi:predicted ATP-dependent endonuclease of OLD family
MLKVFRNLVENGHQIIYATHTPSLIEIDKLHNIGLVVNTEDNGTVVESLTSSNIDSQHKRDALQPISEAMGLEPFNDFTIISKKNIILEGLSDFWYFKAMSIILNKKNEYKFVPGI